MNQNLLFFPAIALLSLILQSYQLSAQSNSRTERYHQSIDRSSSRDGSQIDMVPVKGNSDTGFPPSFEKNASGYYCRGLGVWMSDITFVNSLTGIIAGDFGSIFRTMNGGLSWRKVPSGVESDLLGVAFADEETGIIVGKQGMILRTTDGGSTWTDRSKDSNDTPWTTQPLWGVSFNGTKTGIAVGRDGTILRTTNVGESWTRQISGVTCELFDIAFSLENGSATAIAVGLCNTILRTTDGGINWSAQSFDSTAWLISVSFCDQYRATATGRVGLILQTTDGGMSWQKQTSGSPDLISGVYFTDCNNGVVVGYEGAILRTVDGGDTWTAQNDWITKHLSSVWFTDANNGIAVGESIFSTTNGGISWMEYPAPEKDNIHLSQNFPNPFTSNTSIPFHLKKREYVLLNVYNAAGQVVDRLVHTKLYPGTWVVTWNVGSLASGLYFCVLRIGDITEVIPMVSLNGLNH